jgi:hypothetical protein
MIVERFRQDPYLLFFYGSVVFLRMSDLYPRTENCDIIPNGKVLAAPVSWLCNAFLETRLVWEDRVSFVVWIVHFSMEFYGGDRHTNWAGEQLSIWRLGKQSGMGNGRISS